jgi:hypothetical protein
MRQSSGGEYTLNIYVLSDIISHQFPVTRCLMMRSRLYRSQDLIAVIQDMFFSGGSASFAARHDALFPRHHAGTSLTREMSMAMVSIVATGVS